MPRFNGAAQKPHTHFETVPVEIVKAIATEDVPTGTKIRPASESLERPAKKTRRTPVPTRAPARKRP